MCVYVSGCRVCCGFSCARSHVFHVFAFVYTPRMPTSFSLFLFLVTEILFFCRAERPQKTACGGCHCWGRAKGQEKQSEKTASSGLIPLQLLHALLCTSASVSVSVPLYVARSPRIRHVLCSLLGGAPVAHNNTRKAVC